MSSAVRLFVALDLPDDVRSALVEWRERAFEGVEGVRLLAPSSMHMTLCFLGWRALDEVDEIATACAGAVGPSLSELSLGEALWLPARGRPRVAAVGVADPLGAVASLQSSLADALSAGGWYAREERPFLGHVTLARVARGARVRRASIATPPAIEFAGSTVSLFRSHLGAGGARYEAVRVFELEGVGGGVRRGGAG